MSQPSPARRPRPATIRLHGTVDTPFTVPQPRLPLVGREVEMETVRALLADARAPLVTLTGPGGSGKTSLAIGVANLLRERFADGIWFVDLSALRDPALVPTAILQELGLRESGALAAPSRLEHYLRSRSVLLVLDNFEQVVEAATDISALLTSCPNLQVLATSRRPLHVTMEHLVRIPPLALPPDSPTTTPRDVEAAPAIQVFQLAARRAMTTFEVTATNARTIASICRQLDGLPLAIELAAAQITLYAPEILLARLDGKLAALGEGPRDAPSRLRSMQDAIGWSYDLLDARLQQRFRRLCVFDGGFTSESAAIVTAVAPLNAATVDEDLAALADASLIVADPQTGRFTMLETIREFGLHQLGRRDEHEEARLAHAEWCASLLEAAYPQWYSPAQSLWGDLLDQEHANLRAALTWRSSTRDQTQFVQMVGLMWPFWFVRGHWNEGLSWLQRALSTHESQTSLQHLRLLAGLTCLWMMKGDIATSTRYCEQTLALSELVDGMTSTDQPYNPMALCANARGDQVEGAHWNAIAIDWLRQRADSEPNALPMVSVILNNLAWSALLRGEVDEAERHAQEAQAIQQDLGFEWAAADSFYVLACIADSRGHHREATTFHHQSLRCAVNAHDQALVADLFLQFANHANTAGFPERACLLLGASERLHELLDGTMGDSRHEAADTIVRNAGAALGHEAVDHWRLAGRAMRIEDAASLVFQTPVPNPQPDPLVRFGLTRREREVLALVAEGMTDQEIANRLSISLRTANAHVANLLGKMQVESRRHAAAIAREALVIETPTEARSPKNR